MNRTLVIVVVVILVVLGVWYFSSRETIAPSDTDTATTTDSGSTSTTTDSMGGVGADMVVDVSTSTTKTFAVASSNFKFSVGEIRVKQGDKVSITLTNTAGTHNLEVEGYNVETKTLNQAGQTDTIEFTADKKGTFEYFCDIGTHRQMGMVGNLIVE